jgi:heme/copper-type cytochrome/quinol oxidase subunit 1
MVQQYRDDTATQHLDETQPDHEPDAPPHHRADARTSAATEVDPAYRGFKGGAAFFGWLVAIGLTALLTGIVGAIAAGVDYAITIDWNSAKSDAGTIGIASGIVLALILAIAYYSGGYVAGRLARFDGARQGFGVWLIGVLVTVVVAAIAGLAGSQYDVLDRGDLPSLPIADDTVTAAGLVVLGVIVVVTLFAALIGGKAGQRYHRRIDISGD